MKRAVGLFFWLLIAAVIGIWMYEDSGYVLIAFQNWSVETTLWVLVIAVLLIFVILNLVTAILKKIIFIPKFINYLFKNRKIKKARKQTRIGLYAWVEGKSLQAERMLIKAAPKSDIGLINYLIAAKAAHKQGDYPKCDFYLNKAREASFYKQTAVDLAQAHFLIKVNQFDRAVEILSRLQQQSPKSTYTLQLLHEAYFALKDWHKLQALLPSLYKYKALTKLQLTELEKQIYLHLLYEKNKDLVALNNFWLSIPRNFRRNNEILLVYIESLMQNPKQQITAEKLLRYALKKNWDEKLIEKYGLVAGDKPIKQLAFAEYFLNAHRNSAALLLCLGRICKKLQLWGKAQNYFEIGLRLKETPVVYQELGQLMELLNHKEMALEYYRKALQVKNSL